MYEVHPGPGNRFILYKTGDGGFDLVAWFADRDDAEFARAAFEGRVQPQGAGNEGAGDLQSKLTSLQDGFARLRKQVASAQQVFNSPSLSWKHKFEMLFTHKREVINPLLKSLGLKLDWCDPDGSYQDDVTAYFVALRDLVETLPQDSEDTP